MQIGNSKETTTHKKITKYSTLSICGSSKNFGGQIEDDLFKSDVTLKDYKKVKAIVKIWKEWHLNDLSPNCEHQKSFNCNVDNYSELAEIETKKCPKGYKYGTNWLIKELPLEIQNKIKDLFNNYPK